jgi:hypothetical protein
MTETTFTGFPNKCLAAESARAAIVESGFIESLSSWGRHFKKLAYLLSRNTCSGLEKLLFDTATMRDVMYDRSSSFLLDGDDEGRSSTTSFRGTGFIALLYVIECWPATIHLNIEATTNMFCSPMSFPETKTASKMTKFAQIDVATKSTVANVLFIPKTMYRNSASTDRAPTKTDTQIGMLTEPLNAYGENKHTLKETPDVKIWYARDLASLDIAASIKSKFF